MPMRGDNLLMVADAEPCANMRYATRQFVRAPLIYLRLAGRGFLLTSQLPPERARRDSQHCELISLEALRQDFRAPGDPQPSLAQTIHRFLRQQRVSRVVVPDTFPIGLARELEHFGIRIRLPQGPLFPQRARKTAEEIKKISASLIMAEVGLAEGLQALKSARIGHNRRLVYHSVTLTAEKLRAIIDTAILQAGGQVGRTIVASGLQGCSPTESGHGPLRAHETILLDVCCRSQKTGYFGHLSRTVVKGRAQESIRKLHHTIDQAQDLALSLLRASTPCRQVHDKTARFLREQGYRSDPFALQPSGFLHAVGNGIGLDHQETPWLGPGSRDRLQPGNVIALRPGLYYPELGGGVRLGDVVLVTHRLPRNLTRFERSLDIG